METLLVIGAAAVVLAWAARSGPKDRYLCERLGQRIKDRWAYWRAKR